MNTNGLPDNNELIIQYLSTSIYKVINDTGIKNIWKDIFSLKNNEISVTLGEKDYPTNFNNLVRYIMNKHKAKLDKGKEEYDEFVPITMCECKPTSRDNLAEALDELLDMNVYLAAAILGDKYTEIRPLLEKVLDSLLTNTLNITVLYKSTQQRLTEEGDNNG
jgi:hypothetical protein|tara:strand:+ start:1042 stop:1530 length:489 start_codon:yes stop_codon:yes gene_type:complete